MKDGLTSIAGFTYPSDSLMKGHFADEFLAQLEGVLPTYWGIVQMETKETLKM